MFLIIIYLYIYVIFAIYIQYISHKVISTFAHLSLVFYWNEKGTMQILSSAICLLCSIVKHLYLSPVARYIR